jgi:hypothetical protein
VGEDVGLHAPVHAGPVVEPGADVGPATGLPPLAHERPDLTGAPLLLLLPRMEVELGPVHFERDQSTALVLDFEGLVGEIEEVGAARSTPFRLRVTSPWDYEPASRRIYSTRFTSPECSTALGQMQVNWVHIFQ